MEPPGTEEAARRAVNSLMNIPALLSRFAGKGLLVSENGYLRWYVASMSIGALFSSQAMPRNGLTNTLSYNQSKPQAWNHQVPKKRTTELAHGSVMTLEIASGIIAIAGILIAAWLWLGKTRYRRSGQARCWR
jgi:NADH:ubiquinone oxidoreductase subunit 5 (subunit L)/multisubunit Na+/H+ antiporter MnhA subunit